MCACACVCVCVCVFLIEEVFWDEGTSVEKLLPKMREVFRKKNRKQSLGQEKNRSKPSTKKKIGKTRTIKLKKSFETPPGALLSRQAEILFRSLMEKEKNTAKNKQGNLVGTRVVC